MLTIKNNVSSTPKTSSLSAIHVADETYLNHNKLQNLTFEKSGHTGFAGIIQKTTAEWNNLIDYIPLSGVLIIYTDTTDKNNNSTPMIKIGDGHTRISNLPFVANQINSNGWNDIQEAIDSKINDMDYNPILNIKILSKTTEEWESNSNFKTEKNVIYIYTDKYNTTDENGNIITTPGVKLGDGNAYLNDKSFISDGLLSRVLIHLSNQILHVTSDDKKRWDNKLNFIDPGDTGILEFTRN